MAVGVEKSIKLVVVTLTLGLIRAWPLFLGRNRHITRLLLAVAVYGATAGWIVNQQNIDWNMPDRFNPEFTIISMKEGRVVWADYSPS